MKRIVIAVLLLATLLCCFAACKEEGVPENMQKAYADNAKFRLYVPTNWTVEKAMNYAVSPNLDGACVMATSELVTLAYTPDTYFEQKAWGEICATVTDAELLETSATTLSGLDAKCVVYQCVVAGEAMRYMQIITVDGAMVYTLTYAAKPQDFDNNLEDVEKIRAEFKIN